MILEESEHYWLKQAHIPACLLADQTLVEQLPLNRDGLVLVDLEIKDGMVVAIAPSACYLRPLMPELDVRQGMVVPCFVELHTHLDKGHIWERSPNPDGTFATALSLSGQDSEHHWTVEDVYRRMKFGLQCSYVHGTQALRTHMDASGEQAEISLTAFKTLQQEWAGRLTLQAVPLVPLEYFLTSAGETLADQMAEVGGSLGGLTKMNADLDQVLDRVFELAKERQLTLDFHTDESLDPCAQTLRHVAQATLRHEFTGQVICGHCCSLSVQSEAEVATTLNLVKQAGIGIVSLPMCNLYLQDRHPHRTPRYRGVTLLHELKQAGIPVALSSDNCRDPFYGFGDHDGLEVFSFSTKIAHLDRPYGDWIRAVTQTPADLMGLPNLGRIAVGQPANLVIFRARNYSELLARSQHNRIVMRQGRRLQESLPDYSELDDLIEHPPQKR